MKKITVYNGGTRPLGYSHADQTVVLYLGANEVDLDGFVTALGRPRSELLQSVLEGNLRLDGHYPSQVKVPRKRPGAGYDLEVKPDEHRKAPAIHPLYTTQAPCAKMQALLEEHKIVEGPKRQEVEEPEPVYRKIDDTIYQVKPDGTLVPMRVEQPEGQLEKEPEVSVEPTAQPASETQPVSETQLVNLDSMSRSELREYLTSVGVEFDGRASKDVLLGLARAAQ